MGAKPWIEAARGVLVLPHNDQVSIGTAIAKDLNPALFARDYAYHDLSLWTFYTPFPLWLAKVLWQALGSYELALAALVPVLLGVYVLGMYRLAWLVCGNHWVSLAVALISAAPRSSIGSELWGLEGAHTVAPRALFWAASPWLFWILFRQRARGWRSGVIVGLSLGVMTNLHPVSALPAVEILGLLALATAPHWRTALAEIVGLASGAVIGGLPTVLTFFGGLRGVAGTPSWISFETFTQLTRERLLTIFPHKQLHYPFMDVAIGPVAQEIAVWTYLLFLVAMAVSAWRARAAPQETARLWRVFAIGQLPIAYLMTATPNGGLALVIVAVVYVSVYRLEDIDKLLVRLLAIVTSLVWLGSYALVRLWEFTQSWSLTTLMAEHSRGARLIYVPLSLILARLSARLLADEPGSLRRWAVVVALWASVFATPDIPLGVLAVLAIVWLRGAAARQRAWSPAVSDALLAGALLWPIAHLLFAPRPAAALTLVGVVLISGSQYVSAAFPAGRRQLRYTAIAIALTAGVAAGLVWRTGFAHTVLGRMIVPRSYVTLGRASRDLLDLSAWARQKTAADALFFFGHPGPSLIRATDAEFRFRAERSLTHSWKDIGVAYYSRVRLVEFHERYHALERARRDPVKLLSCARSLGTDYVVLSADEHLGLPVAYRNSTYAVYRLSGQATDASRSEPWTVPSDCR